MVPSFTATAASKLVACKGADTDGWRETKACTVEITAPEATNSSMLIGKFLNSTGNFARSGIDSLANLRHAGRSRWRLPVLRPQRPRYQCWTPAPTAAQVRRTRPCG